MLDTTVYVHRLQNKIPPPIHALIEARTVLHCAVAVAEIAISAGIMDPTHATIARYRTPLLGLLHGISALDMRAPSPDAWAEASKQCPGMCDKKAPLYDLEHIERNRTHPESPS